MKRRGDLMWAIAEPDNLRLAFLKAARGKRDRPAVRAFAQDLERSIGEVRGQLLSGTFPVGAFRAFTVFDPKEERAIHAASFPERVMHHAVMNLCEPALEVAAVFDSYACRKGKGRLAAVARAQHFAGLHEWFLKMDVAKYFDSVDHTILLAHRSRVRLIRKWRRYEVAFASRRWSELELQRRVTALLAFVRQASGFHRGIQSGSPGSKKIERS